MPDYEIDIAGDQIVHWLKDELKAATPRVRYRVTRDFAADEDPGLEPEFEAAGIDPDDDSSSLVTVGLLEITPADPAGGWQLTVRVEDVVGTHVPEDDSVSGFPEEIDLDDFQAQFANSDSNTQTVSLNAGSDSAKTHFDRLFAELVRDRHKS
jgi:hypothetical protein